ncbi:FkbM family methyltransferase [Phaeovulum vinaykumarii]|uniref:FkbM family methyltransferase n=1 Tax=Phaeovulum vinaykumarii TaxID=407234 RepID=UPI0013565FCE|nr:FkbM family methyltransferase [Phaeovulum vinaykumarii]
MARFSIRGVTLDVPDDGLTGHLRKALEGGYYEAREAELLKAHLRPGDRVLELGAGAGFITTLAARSLGGAQVLAVEAGAQMVEAARANLATNGIVGTEILWGAVVPDDFAPETVAFLCRPAFWASGIAPEGGVSGGVSGAAPRAGRIETVPALRIGALIARHAPSVIVADIEGAELDLLAGPLPDDLRLLILELHPDRYGAAGMARMFR